ncbi:3778_t:CDS:2, partial [Gigaspora rosea]
MTSPHKHILLAGREWCMRASGCCLVESNDQATMTELIGKEQKQQTQETKEPI